MQNVILNTYDPQSKLFNYKWNTWKYRIILSYRTNAWMVIRIARSISSSICKIFNAKSLDQEGYPAWFTCNSILAASSGWSYSVPVLVALSIISVSLCLKEVKWLKKMFASEQ